MSGHNSPIVAIAVPEAVDVFAAKVVAQLVRVGEKVETTWVCDGEGPVFSAGVHIPATQVTGGLQTCWSCGFAVMWGACAGAADGQPCDSWALEVNVSG